MARLRRRWLAVRPNEAKLLQLIGARRDEVAGMKWGEIGLAGRIWSLAVGAVEEPAGSRSPVERRGAPHPR